MTAYVEPDENIRILRKIFLSSLSKNRISAGVTMCTATLLSKTYDDISSLNLNLHLNSGARTGNYFLRSVLTTDR